MRHFIDETINRKNLEAIDKLVLPTLSSTFRCPDKAGAGRAQAGHPGFLTAFPDIRWTTDEQVAEGDTVVSRFTWTGTQRGASWYSPTNRTVTVWGVVVDVIRQGQFGRAASSWIPWA